jgi:hypothetical protein
MRGCFGGCTFCSITEHEGRIIQNRSEDSILREIEKIRDTAPQFTGIISDLGGPTANMYRSIQHFCLTVLPSKNHFEPSRHLSELHYRMKSIKLQITTIKILVFSFALHFKFIHF